MSTTTSCSQANDVEVDATFASLFSSLSKANASTAADIQSIHEKLEGPSGVIQFLLRRIWLSAGDSQSLQGDNALFILSHLVESRPAEYMALTASSVRRDIDRHFVASHEQSKVVSDALLMALAKLIIGRNSDDQVGIATDASASLLALCRWDGGQNHCNSIAKRVLSIIDTLWYHLQAQGKQQQRESSTSQMRIAALMIDVSLLGGEEMSLALVHGNDNNSNNNCTQCIMDKLLHIALDFPNADPLLQMSALDQLERLTVHDDAQYPVSMPRADFLLANDILRRGLLCLVGSPGDLSKDANANDEWGEVDPINGAAALRLLTEICRVGVSSYVSISEATRNKFHILISSFQKALNNFHPQGELERLFYVYAVSSLVGSCAMVASSTTLAADVANTVLSDNTLLSEWLSLHSRVSQPKLKSTVLCSLSKVMEPTIWKDDGLGSDITRPNDSIVLQLYQAFSHANNDRDSTELILASAKSPFEEERLGAYNMLRALVMRGVGVRLLLLYDDGSGSGFLDWLLNQELESAIEGKKAKYQIVDSMLSANSNLLGGLLPARALRQLEEWRRGGPNFMTTVSWELATE